MRFTLWHRTKATLLLHEFSRELLPRKHASDKGRITLSEARAYQSQPTPPLSPGDTDERKSVRGMHVPSSSGSGDEVELGLFAPRAHGGHMGDPPSKGRADIIGGLCSQRMSPSGREMCGTVPQQARKSDTGRRHIFLRRSDILGVPFNVLACSSRGENSRRSTCASSTSPPPLTGPPHRYPVNMERVS